MPCAPSSAFVTADKGPEIRGTGRAFDVCGALRCECRTTEAGAEGRVILLRACPRTLTLLLLPLVSPPTVLCLPLSARILGLASDSAHRGVWGGFE